MTTIPWDTHPQVYSSPYITSRKESGRVHRLDPDDRIEYAVRPGRRVNFSSIIKTDSTTHFITEEEGQAIWYSSKELRELSSQDRDLVLTAKQLGHNDEEFCLRGLETILSRRAALEQRSRRISIVKAVLFEQSDGDPARIRKKSLAISKEARHLAALHGQQDAEAVSVTASNASIVIDHKTRTICL
ncbi:hypothetical protein FisN_14Hh087 [Fistulifera solaris]|uniref:Uncharacterized protein n=1 Tax=Fistulifera solaris TaxID=1519565 RepID=A0A1Z5K8J6_FISSO|nr:hypothetical protein FisN_14Hh087 [Fistulifera solaris]|eukprot:GAX22472.1 hypothetical protein FisN_14Hh087 [Fistulifera solaris]